MLENKNTLKNAAWILIILGVIETLFLVYAIQTKTNFSGGSVLYIIIGFFVLKKDKFAYKLSQFIFTMLVLAVPAMSLMYLLIFFEVHFSSDIPVNYSLISYNSIYFIAYLGMVCYLVMLLHHPNTRKALSLDEYTSNIYTLFIPLKRVITVSLIFFVLSVLLSGPSILKNPYKQIVEGLSKDVNVYSEVGHIISLDMLSSNTNNWTVYSFWRVNGDKGKGVYITSLDTDSKLTIEEYGRKRAPLDCKKTELQDQNASLNHNAC